MAKRKRRKSRTAQKPVRATRTSKDSNIYAFIATFFSIIGFIVALIAWKKDKYVMFYAKQSLVLFIVYIIVYIVGLILVWIPILGWLVMAVLNITVLILWIMTWIYALSGKMKDVWLIGSYAKNWNF